MVTITRFGPNVEVLMKGEVRRLAKAIREGVEKTGKSAQEKLRNQARSAGFRDKGKAIANTWRLKMFPSSFGGTPTLRPAALIWSKMPNVVSAFDRGATIIARKRKYLAIPTAVNAKSGRRGRLRVTTQAMMQAARRGETKMMPVRGRHGTYLWCINLYPGSKVGRRLANGRLTRSTRLRLFVDKGTEVLTGNRKGSEAIRRAALAKGSIAMFLLTRRVQLRRRLNVRDVETSAGAEVVTNVRTAILSA